MSDPSKRENFELKLSLVNQKDASAFLQISALFTPVIALTSERCPQKSPFKHVSNGVLGCIEYQRYSSSMAHFFSQNV